MKQLFLFRRKMEKMKLVSFRSVRLEQKSDQKRRQINKKNGPHDLDIVLETVKARHVEWSRVAKVGRRQHNSGKFVFR